MKRAAYLTALKFSPVSDARFSATAYWVDKHGKGGELTKKYAAGSVFLYNGPRGVKLRQTPCRFADDLIREVLVERGVIS